MTGVIPKLSLNLWLLLLANSSRLHVIAACELDQTPDNEIKVRSSLLINPAILHAMS